jgi:hypothetical protein
MPTQHVSMGNTTSDANRVERDLMARIDTLNANYSHLYKSYECKKHELNQIREENALLKNQMSCKNIITPEFITDES